MSPQPSSATSDEAVERLASHPLLGRVEHLDDAIHVWGRSEDVRVKRDEASIVLGALVEEHLQQWSEVYDHTYSGPASDPDLDLSGWRASDTGQPFPRSQMVEWADRTTELILRTNPRTVLEVGCGTGILLHRMLPHIERYIGVDVAAEVITRHQNAGLSGATFCHAAAHQLRTPAVAGAISELGDIDTIVMNSVSQCFGSVDYLSAVVHDMISLVRPGGVVIVGDVRHSGLQEHFVRWLTAATEQPSRPPTLDDTEMLLDPSTLAQVAAGAPQPTRLVTLPRTLSADTELSRYRFDAVFLVSGEHAAGRPLNELDWQPNALLTDDHDARTPAELHARCRDGEIVVLHPESPKMIAVAGSMAAGSYTAEDLTTPGQPHQPLGAFTRRKLAGECRRGLRAVGPTSSEIVVHLPWSAPLSRTEANGLTEAFDTAGRAGCGERSASRLAASMDDLNQIALQAVADFLGRNSPLGGGPASIEDVCAAVGSTSERDGTVRRWLTMLVDHGWAQPTADERFTLTNRTASKDLLDGPLLEQACSGLGCPDVAVFLRTSLSGLGDLFSDRAPIRSSTSVDGDAVTMMSVGTRYVHGALRTVAADMGARAARPLSVVELSSGAGAATAVVVEGLGDATDDYSFVDVPTLLGTAVQDRSGVLVDVAQDPIGHNSSPDLVLAVNVFHRATDVGEALRWIRRFVSPHGGLMMVESVAEPPIVLATMQRTLSGRQELGHIGSGDRRAGIDRVVLPAPALRAELAEAGWGIRHELPHPGAPHTALGQILLVCQPTP